MAIIQKAKKVVIYGTEGIGKTTLAASFPKPMFIDTEGSTAHYDVERLLYRPESWSVIIDMLTADLIPATLKLFKEYCQTLVIDTADWVEKLCNQHVCDKAKKTGIEDFGYGKGYTYALEEFGKLLNLLDRFVEAGINVVFTAHATIRKFEQPDEMGAYDRWELKCSKQISPMLKEWADIVLFCNYKTYSVAVDDSGKKRKGQGGERVMYTTHQPAWDAKNRFGLPDEVPMSFDSIAHIFTRSAVAPVPKPESEPEPEPLKVTQTPSEPKPKSETDPDPIPEAPENDAPTKFSALNELMLKNGVTEKQIREAVAYKGFYPEKTPINSYDPEFVNALLIAGWDKLTGIIKELSEVPFN